MNGRATTWGVFKAYVFFIIKTECIARRAQVIQLPIQNPIIPSGIDKVPTEKCVG